MTTSAPPERAAEASTPSALQVRRASTFPRSAALSRRAAYFAARIAALRTSRGMSARIEASLKCRPSSRAISRAPSRAFVVDAAPRPRTAVPSVAVRRWSALPQHLAKSARVAFARAPLPCPGNTGQMMTPCPADQMGLRPDTFPRPHRNAISERPRREHEQGGSSRALFALDDC